MNIYQIEKYAQEKGFNTVRFLMFNKKGGFFVGKFLDAYFGMVHIDRLGEGFIRLEDLIKQFGDDAFTFEVIGGDDDEDEEDEDIE